MARKHRNYNAKILKLQERVAKLLDTPLINIAKAQLAILNTIDNQIIVRGDKQDSIDYISELLELLPKKFDERFYFDDWVIRSICQMWDKDEKSFSNMIIPIYSDQWGHRKIPIQMIEIGSIHDIDLIYIRREKNTTIPFLLDYPWLCHELGHYLLLKHNQILYNYFLPYVEKKILQLKKIAIADRGFAKVKSQNQIQELNETWCKSQWIREIAADMIALFACGAAYLESFQEQHEDITNAFLLEADHPPVELRTNVLVSVAKKLGWVKYSSSLCNKFHGIMSSDDPSKRRSAFI